MNEAIHYFSTGSAEAFPLEAGVRRHVGSCLRMRVGSCLRVQVGVEGASGDVCHVREFTLGAGVRPRRARCLVCLVQHCVISDAPTGSPSLAKGGCSSHPPCLLPGRHPPEQTG